MPSKKLVRIALVVLSVLFAFGTSWWAWRWVLPRGKPFYRAVAYTSFAEVYGPYVSPKGTNKVRKISISGMSGPFYVSIVYKHWLYGARELIGSVVWGAYGENESGVIWDSETSFRTMELRPSHESGSEPAMIKIDLDK